MKFWSGSSLSMTLFMRSAEGSANKLRRRDNACGWFAGWYVLTVRDLKTVAVLLLLALWVPASSHALLEEAGLIHEQAGDSDAAHDHDGADGLCLAASHTTIQAKAPVLAVAEFLPLLTAADYAEPDLFGTGAAKYNPSPPEISASWQIYSRAALPVRAPSCLS